MTRNSGPHLEVERYSALLAILACMRVCLCVRACVRVCMCDTSSDFALSSVILEFYLDIQR